MSVRSPAKVLVTVKGLGIGGAERLISEGARFWDRERFEYHVAYSLPWKDQLVSELTRLSVPVYCIGRVGRSSIPSIAGLRRLVASVRPDLIHAHLPSMGILARLGTKPVVYTEHNLADSYHVLTKTVNKASYGRNRAVIAVSDAVAKSLAGYPGPVPEVIVNGVDCRVDPGRAEAARTTLGIGIDTPLVVHIGNIRPGKGHATLIEAAATLREDVPDVLVVSIGGEKWPGDLDRLRAAIAKESLDRNVRLMGRREDALDFLAAADVYVNPADFEGLPVALLEAMALGRPVVATAVGGVPDVIHAGENGLLVEPSAPHDLAEAIKRLLDDRPLGKLLGQRAQIDVERDHGLAAMVRKVEGVYDRVLARSD